MLPSNIPQMILPFIICSACFLFLNYVLVTIFQGYLPNLVELAMYTYASVWLMNILEQSNRRSTLIFRIAISLLAIVLYPVIIHPEVCQYLNLFLESNTIALIPFLMHFFCVGFMILILLQTNRVLSHLYPRSGKTHLFRNLMMIILVTFILLTEYDHFSLLWFNHTGDVSFSEILLSNKFAPYSIILISVAISLLIYSIIRYSRSLRRISLLMIFLVIIKIFILDLKIVAGSTIVLLLITVGLILISVALIIRRIRKKRNNPM